MLFLLLACLSAAPPAVDAAPKLSDLPAVVDAPAAVDVPAVVDVPAAPVPPPAFVGAHSPIPEAMRAQMRGVTWREGCPVSLDDLALVTVSVHTLGSAVETGQVVVAAAHADGVVEVFRQLFDADFAFTKVAPAHVYGGDDNALMAGDVTSAFNCRKKTGGSSYSEHSYGHAIDINPLRNPYVKGSRVLPPEGARFADRTLSEPGMIVADGVVEQAFGDIGWRWGGRWRSLKDYQHFSATGR